MANTVAYRPSPWRLVATAVDQIGELVTDIPGWDGYECSTETQHELRQAAALLHQAAELLEQGRAREEACNG